MIEEDFIEGEDLGEIREWSDKIIQEITLNAFKSIEKIRLENLREFWIYVLKAFKKEKIEDDEILDMIECVEIYILRRYEDDYLNDEYPNTNYPTFHNNHPLSIGLDSMDYIRDAIWNDAYNSDYAAQENPPKKASLKDADVQDALIKFLKTPAGEEEKAHKEIKEFFINKKIDLVRANYPELQT